MPWAWDVYQPVVNAGKSGLLRSHSDVVRSWNQCWAWTYDLILGDSACGLVSCTTQISTASSTTFSCTLAISASCLAAALGLLAPALSACLPTPGASRHTSIRPSPAGRG